MHQNQKSAESAAPFTIICILLLCAVMLFLIINSFNAIQSVDEELSAMQSQLQTLNSQKEQYGTQLQQAFSSLDMEQAAERLGMEKAA
jgi:predicted PurR-regulated permease PerM